MDSGRGQPSQKLPGPILEIKRWHEKTKLLKERPVAYIYRLANANNPPGEGGVGDRLSGQHRYFKKEQSLIRNLVD